MKLIASELPIGTKIVIGDRTWALHNHGIQEPHAIRFRDDSPEGLIMEPFRWMYLSEVQALIDAGFVVRIPRYAIEE